MLIAARAMQAGLKVIKPLLVSGEVRSLAKVVIGTVKGDLHDIGKNLVGMMLEGVGMEVIDLGVDVPLDRFAIEAAGLCSSVKILVRGAPVSQSYADEIGVDGYAPDAGSAVDKVKELLL